VSPTAKIRAALSGEPAPAPAPKRLRSPPDLSEQITVTRGRLQEVLRRKCSDKEWETLRNASAADKEPA
jgi:hypothetical protein